MLLQLFSERAKTYCELEIYFLVINSFNALVFQNYFTFACDNLNVLLKGATYKFDYYIYVVFSDTTNLTFTSS